MLDIFVQVFPYMFDILYQARQDVYVNNVFIFLFYNKLSFYQHEINFMQLKYYITKWYRYIKFNTL